MTRIPKVAQDAAPFERRFLAFESARAAMGAFLRTVCRAGGRGILLPSYIGWSPREGSGVLDPVRELGIPYTFYRLDADLRIDLDDLARRLEETAPEVLLLIHYFGYADPAYADCVALARSRGVIVLEDEAHAMLTDLIGGRTGRLGDAALFSLHKLLPVASGGGLLLNPSTTRGRDLGGINGPHPWQFDLAELSRRRRLNAVLLEQLLEPLAGRVDILWRLGEGVVPQTLPVRIRVGTRDQLYEDMNRAGFGVVSLYHTLIAELPREAHADILALSRCIMNLPVHQGADEPALTAMVAELDRLTTRAGR
jgi:dTDP-4-amino-4,6-dideoxygalactose transaminase